MSYYISLIYKNINKKIIITQPRKKNLISDLSDNIYNILNGNKVFKNTTEQTTLWQSGILDLYNEGICLKIFQSPSCYLLNDWKQCQPGHQ